MISHQYRNSIGTPVVGFLVQDPFIVKPRPVTILQDLVERTKVAATEHDNAVARRLERMMTAVNGTETSGSDFCDSTVSLSASDNITVGESRFLRLTCYNISTKY